MVSPFRAWSWKGLIFGWLWVISCADIHAQKPFLISWDLGDEEASQGAFHQCRFYVGDFHFYLNDELVFSDSTYHLVDLMGAASIEWPIIQPVLFNTFTFRLGVDSITHELGVMSGDLDPSLNMYWTWQSGYIDAKLEGNFIIDREKQIFELHLGGYQFPFRADQEVIVRCPEIQSGYVFQDVFGRDFFHQLSVYPHYIMSPQKGAVPWMDWIAKRMSR
jgi:hypothetical protein